ARNYWLLFATLTVRAVDDAGEEVRVIVDARLGRNRAQKTPPRSPHGGVLLGHSREVTAKEKPRSKATKADPWGIRLRPRRPPLVVAVALANKTARIAWAGVLRQKEYQARGVAA